MRVREAKEAARRWVWEVGCRLPGFQGAYFGGSINWREDGSDLPATSDVDIYVVIEGDEAALEPRRQRDLKHRKLRYGGVLLETNFYPSSRFATAEQVLADYPVACHLARPSLIADPSGHLARLQRIVARDFARSEWVTKRCENVRDSMLRSVMEPLGTATGTFQAAHCICVVPVWLSHILLVADLQNPTVIKGPSVSKRILASGGRLDLHERMLALLGAVGMDRSAVEGYLDELTRCFDRAVQVRSRPCSSDWNLCEEAREDAIGGPGRLVESGDHREAMWWILRLRLLCQEVIRNDAPEEEKEPFERGLERLLAGLSLSAETVAKVKAAEARALLDDVMQFAREMIARDPRMI